ncbi:MAG: LysM peptidoglycan-binding domain-containing protein [Anaerolineae bacterium]
MHKMHVARIVLVLALVALSLGLSGLGAAADEPLYHTVRWGETLSSIAHKYGVSVSALAEANALRNLNLVYAGQRLVIPGVVATEYTSYTVKRGDSLLSIAAKFGVSVRDLVARNNIRNSNLVFVGQTLIIPGTATTGATATPTPTPAGSVTPTPTAAASSGIPTTQEAIIISSPAQDADVSSPVTVTGWGSGFENTLAVDILDENGETIGQGYVTIDAEVGQIGPFTGTVVFEAPASVQMGRISVYSISPRDGAIEHLTSVSVNLQPAE